MTEIINFEDEGEMGSMGRYARHIAAKKSETKAPGPSAPFAELMRQPATSSRYAPPIAPEPEPPAPAEQEILAAPPKFNSNSEPTNGYAEPPDGAHGHHLPTAEPEVQAGALHEQLLAEPAPRHPALVAAWRDVATASDDGDKREAFQLAAIEIGGLVDSGDIEHAEGFDDLIDLGEEHRLFRGREDLEHVIGQGFKGIRALPVPKVNGQAKPAQPEGPEPPPAEQEPTERGQVARAEESRSRKPDPKAEPLEFTDASSFEGKPVPDQRWLAHERIPMEVPTLLYGDGGTGKSRIAMQLGVATLLGTDWLGSVIDSSGPVLFYTAEDKEEHCHRVLDRIAAHLKISLGRLKGLMIRCMEDDPELAFANRQGVIVPTRTYDRLCATARQVKPALTVLDTQADIFPVDENNRVHARQCVAMLRQLSRESGGGAVLPLAHPSIAGMSSGRGTSGSTGWGNSVRSRMYFRNLSEDEDGRDDGMRELRVKKNNYGQNGETVRVVWKNGVFVPLGSTAPLAQVDAEAEADRAFLDCLDAATAQGRHVFAKTGSSFAPKVFQGMPQARGLKAPALERAQERLFAAGRIHVATIGPPSRQVHPIARKPFAEAAG